jgi:uncharacterized protein YcbX
MRRMTAVVTALSVYPVKGGRGVALEAATIAPEGLQYDRQWLVVTPDGRFVTQREWPRLALLGAVAEGTGLVLSFPDGATLRVPRPSPGASRPVAIWSDHCAGRDCGDEAARALSTLLGTAVRLVEFDDDVPRLANPRWAGEVVAPVRYPDGFPLLLISAESLDDLNARLPAPLPMNRFRPNLVVRGLGAFGEDRVRELRLGGVTLRPVKACTRCKVTMTDQRTAEVAAQEPLRTLKTYRWDAELRGITFGQNVVIASGVGEMLRIGDEFEVEWR